MTNYILVGLVITLALALVIATESKSAKRARRAQLQGIREGINMTSIAMMRNAREAYDKYGEQNPIDIETVTMMLHTQIELEEWAEL